MSNPLARFVIGGILGYLWERKVAPDLPGALPIPFRPIYGCGAAAAGSSYADNCYRATVLEALAHSQRPDLWNYDESDPLTITKAVKGDNMAAFGAAMTLADAAFRKCGI